jgi:hypothetical protein
VLLRAVCLVLEKVRTAQDRVYLENAIGDLKVRMSLKNTNTLERQA